MEAVLKEWYWLVIIGAIVGMAFLPSVLKEKCISCKRRKLTPVVVDDHVLANVDPAERKPFLYFFKCDACGAKLKREKSGPMEDASSPVWKPVFDTEQVRV